MIEINIKKFFLNLHETNLKRCISDNLLDYNNNLFYISLNFETIYVSLTYHGLS